MKKYIPGRFECIEPECTNRVSRKHFRCRKCAALVAKTKISKALKNRVFTKEHIEKLSLSKLGYKNPMFKNGLEKNHKSNCRCSFCKSKRGELKGINGVNYLDGRTDLASRIRSLDEYMIWRNIIFERDNFTCQECFKRGNNLESHHQKPFKEILEEFLCYHSQFSPIEDKETLVRLAISYNPFWDIANGKTLCKKCHKSYTYK